ncbi:MAG: hypothetical protein ACKVUT_13205 [Gaiella sp.]
MNTITRTYRTLSSGRRFASLSPPSLASHESVVIRHAGADDADALERLAQLGEHPLPQEPLLVAEVSGELWAALSVADGATVTDPFRPTVELVALLRARAEQLRATERGGKRRGRIHAHARSLTQR